MTIKKFIFFFTFVIAIFLIVILINSSNHSLSDKTFFLPEIDSRLLFLKNRNIIFSANYNGSYQLYSISNLKEIKQLNSQSSCFNPFEFNNNIHYLKDNLGDENFRIFPKINTTVGIEKRIKKIYHDEKGNKFAIVFYNDNNIYIFDIANKSPIIIEKYFKKVNDLIFIKNTKEILLSFDNELQLINYEKKTKINIADELDGVKKNPFFFEGLIYFANNSNSEYFSIYEYNLNLNKLQTITNIENNCDILLPKRYNNQLFFVSVVNNQYLLNMYEMNTHSKLNLTEEGVIYNYFPISNSELIIIYSNMLMPKSICLLKLKDLSINNLTNNESSERTITSTFFEKTNDLSSAYMLRKGENESDKVVLYFHPGLNSDFSPRWDNILFSLVNLGYDIVAPNFPMSFGSGKTFQNCNLKNATLDMLKWNEYLLSCSKKVFFLSSSSGNLIMEKLVDYKFPELLGSVSLFGLTLKNDLDSLNVPYLRIMGKNDPHVVLPKNYKSLNFDTSKIHIFYDEGHWLRKTKNQKRVVEKIHLWFQECEKKH